MCADGLEGSAAAGTPCLASSVCTPCLATADCQRPTGIHPHIYAHILIRTYSHSLAHTPKRTYTHTLTHTHACS